MSMAALSIIPLVLTLSMFATRERMLGYPSLIFWGIFGGWCYSQSEATWDVFYLLFFGCIGMVIFCAIAMYALREKRDALGDDMNDDEEID